MHNTTGRHERSDSAVPLVSARPSVVNCAVLRPAVSPESASRRHPNSQVQLPECHEALALPSCCGSRGSLGGDISTAVQFMTSSVIPQLGDGKAGASARCQQEQLLPSTADVATGVRVDGHKATVSLDNIGLSFSYEFMHCCVPGVRSETVPYSDMLSAEILPAIKGTWRLPGTRLHRLIVWTFRRSPQHAARWHPRQLVLETSVEGVLQQSLQRINAALQKQTRRPRRLLVFVNPFGGSRRAQQIWESTVRPVFDKAGIKSQAVKTEHGGHARALLTSMPAEELSCYDGVVAIGGDGLFHEVINGLLELRSVPSETSLDQQRSAELEQHLNKSAAADAGTAASVSAQQAMAGGTGVQQSDNVREQQSSSTGSFGLPGGARYSCPRAVHHRTCKIAASIRVGHIPAGSTDAVACTLNGTRSAFTAAMHIALGDGCPLDVLRVDTAMGEHAFATCMVSYGFMGDVMAESENYRWLGPMRYDVIGAKMLAANRSYRVRISYLPAEADQVAVAGKVCVAGCGLCRLAREHAQLQKAFREVSSRSLSHRRSEWVHLEGDYAGIMLVIMPCRSEKSQHGVARYGHRSDGLIHLVMVKKCSRLQYLRFLLTLSSTGLAAGEHGFFKVVPAIAVHVEPVGARESHWNADGELLPNNHITAEVHRGVIEVFARGVEV